MQTGSLAQKSCKPCEGGTKPISRRQALDYLSDLAGWALDSSGQTIFKEYTMKNFGAGIDFIQKIAGIAEQEGHHPDLHLTRYRKLRIELATHAIGGLSENDFILASKIEALPKALKIRMAS